MAIYIMTRLVKIQLPNKTLGKCIFTNVATMITSYKYVHVHTASHPALKLYAELRTSP